MNLSEINSSLFKQLKKKKNNNMIDRIINASFKELKYWPSDLGIFNYYKI